MAFVANGDNEEEKQPNGVAPAGAGGVHLASGSGVGSPSAPGSGAAPQKDAGGSFASLDKYVNANQGQAQPLADKVTSGINDQYNSLNQANQSTLQGIGNAVTNAPGYTKSDPNTLSAEAANPVSFASDPNNVKAFQGLLNNSYSGPVSAEGDAGYQAQQAKVNDAISQGNAQTQSEAGRQQLVKNVTAVPTQSVTALNSAILSKDPNALGQIQNAYKPFDSLVSGLSAGAAGIDKQIAQEQADATQSRQAANDALNSQVGALNSSVQSATQAAQDAAKQQNARLSADLTGLYSSPLDTTATTLGTYGGGTTPWANTTNYTVGNLSPQDLQSLGMTADQWQSLQQQMQLAGTTAYSEGHNFGAGSPTTQIDLSPFLTQTDPTQAITAANAATPEQYAQAQAFQSLLGQLPQGLVLDPSKSALAGTAPANGNTFDFNTALSTAQSTAAAERQAAQDEANQISAAGDKAHADSQHHGGMFGGVLGTLGKYLANPLLAVPTEINAAKKVATKIA